MLCGPLGPYDPHGPLFAANVSARSALRTREMRRMSVSRVNFESLIHAIFLRRVAARASATLLEQGEARGVRA